MISKMRELYPEDLSYLVQGACLLASGGGGPVSMGKPLLDLIEKAGNPRIAPWCEVEDDGLVLVLAGAGMPSIVTSETIAPLADAVMCALEHAQKALGAVSYLAPVETGVANTLLPLLASARTGIPVVDGAGSRRSLPSLTMTVLGKVPPSPMIVATTVDSAISVGVESTLQAEEVLMAIVSSMQGAAVGLALWPMRGAIAKERIKNNAITNALDLGKTLRQAANDPVTAVVRFLDGLVLFTGRLGKIQHQTAGGFDFNIANFLSDSGESFSVYSQNESLIAWSSNRAVPATISPDLICYLTEDGEVFTNADIAAVEAENKRVAVIGAPCPDDLEKPALEAYLHALRAIGYGGPLVPIGVLKCIPSPNPEKLVFAPPKAVRTYTTKWRQSPAT